MNIKRRRTMLGLITVYKEYYYDENNNYYNEEENVYKDIGEYEDIYDDQ
jgi:hypothetical protein